MSVWPTKSFFSLSLIITSLLFIYYHNIMTKMNNKEQNIMSNINNKNHTIIRIKQWNKFVDLLIFIVMEFLLRGLSYFNIIYKYSNLIYLHFLLFYIDVYAKSKKTFFTLILSFIYEKYKEMSSSNGCLTS